MKRILLSVAGALLFAVVLVMGVGESTAKPAQANGQANVSTPSIRRCSVGTLRGRYGLSVTGRIDSVGAVAFVGWADFDGSGNVSGADWASINGSVSFRTITNGTYEVDDDCTGKVKFVSPTRNIEVNFALVLVDGGKEVLFIETDQGTMVTGVMRRL